MTTPNDIHKQAAEEICSAFSPAQSIIPSSERIAILLSKHFPEQKAPPFSSWSEYSNWMAENHPDLWNDEETEETPRQEGERAAERFGEKLKEIFKKQKALPESAGVRELAERIYNAILEKWELGSYERFMDERGDWERAEVKDFADLLEPLLAPLVQQNEDLKPINRLLTGIIEHQKARLAEARKALALD